MNRKISTLFAFLLIFFPLRPSWAGEQILCDEEKQKRAVPHRIVVSLDLRATAELRAAAVAAGVLDQVMGVLGVPVPPDGLEGLSELEFAELLWYGRSTSREYTPHVSQPVGLRAGLEASLPLPERVLVHGYVYLGLVVSSAPSVGDDDLVQAIGMALADSREAWAIGDFVTATTVGGILERLRVSEWVTEVEAAQAAPVYRPSPLRLRPKLLSNDPLLSTQWALAQTGVTEAWEYLSSQPGTATVVLIDSGLDKDQSDLGPVEPPEEIHSEDTKGKFTCVTAAEDTTGHGTALAGIIRARTNNKQRVAGVAWTHHPKPDPPRVTLKSIRVLDKRGRAPVDEAARAIHCALEELEPTVITAAWGGTCASVAVKNALIKAQELGVLVVAAAGNGGKSLDTYPDFFPAAFRHVDHYCSSSVCLDNLLAVGATELEMDDRGSVTDGRAAFSNYGPTVVQIGAPGVGIVTTGLVDKGGIAEVNGTSAAVGLVAGAAALVATTYESPPGHARIVIRLLKGAEQVCLLKTSFDYGNRLNVFHAVKASSPDQPICNQN